MFPARGRPSFSAAPPAGRSDARCSPALSGFPARARSPRAAALSAAALLFFTSPLEIITAFREYDALRLAGSIFAVSALCTMVANVAFTKSAEYIDGTESSILSALEVVVGSLAGYLVYHEHLTALQILGMVLVVAGSLGTQIHWGKFLRRKV